MSANATLEPFRDVLARQEPKTPGEAFDMTIFSNRLPKSCGDPWRGAYSKHGIWYKVSIGCEDDFKKLVALSYEQDGYLLCYEDYSRLQKTTDRLLLFVAKNLREDVLGGILITVRDSMAQIGCHFVQEDFRHSGIGSTLLRLALEHFPSSDFVFQPMHHLHQSITKFGLQLQLGRKTIHICLDKPTGFPELRENDGNKNTADLNTQQIEQLCVFLSDITGRHLKDLRQFDGYEAVAAYKEGSCVGFGVRREVAGGDVRRILVGPLYVDKLETAEGILRDLLKEFYNPEDDFDFDPDLQAIYRREVHFFIPEGNLMMLKILRKLAGEERKVVRHRLWYQTASNGLLPAVRLSQVFATENLHFSVV